ncbi:LANO_0H03180g1_1 [Lachancea nothofagi CBS 11611]|uniref:LANO_0H03180g1_1 n=1 Tax=Lachancea nothofagi CBS 11611 TaxID=1266666 RepID=A0A1G4KL85_9SACH|nr:LANO_0H03180g1_1 [Lachancea nothofagi CBS 11611]
MRAALVLSALTAMAAASPVTFISDLFKREVEDLKEYDDDDFDPISLWPGNLTQESNWSNWTTASNGSSLSNGSNGTGMSMYDTPKLQVFITGGEYTMSNWTDSADVSITTLFNQSSLNSTQLFSIASSISSALESDDYTGVVVLGSERSLESLGFFLSVVTDSPKSLVVTSDLDEGIAVATSDDSWWRGVLIAYQGLIYSGAVYTPSNPGAVSIGAVYDGIPWFWYTPAWATMLSPDSTIRNDYTNFTDVAMANSSMGTNTTTIPIVFDGYYNPSLVSSLSSAIKGLVVVSSGNSTSSELKSATIPVVFANEDQTPVLPGDVPDSAVAGGILSPVKAQLLLAIAITNGVTGHDELQSIFI